MSGKRRIQPEMLVGVSAVFIGVCALFVSLYETHLMRQEQRAAVIPMLELARSHFIDPENPDRWRLTLHAENVGIGPAIIQDFVVTVDGKAQPTWQAAMQALLGRESDVAYGQSTINGRTIPPDRMVTMFDLINTEIAPELMPEFHRLDFQACFCSVFGDCWTTSYHAFGQGGTLVDACPASDRSFQE